jgi:hypothetical protein
MVRHDFDGIVNFWHFPKGGKPTKTIKPRTSAFWGVTVSVAK